jgi:hypothetical protein
MNTPLSSFTALVKFRFDRAGLTSEIASIRKQLSSLVPPTIKLKYDKKGLTLPKFINQTVKLKYVGASPNLTPILQSRIVNPKEVKSSIARLGVKTLSLKDAKLIYVPKVKLQASSVSLKGAKFTYIPKLKLQASTISLRDAKYTYKGKLKSKDFPPIKQEVKLHYTGKLTTLPVITQVVNMVYRNRQGNAPPQQTQSGGRGGNTNPWHIGGVAGGLGGLITRGNLAAVGAGAGLQQMYTTANFTAAREPRYEFLTGSKEGGAKQIKYINDLVDELHLNLMDTDEAYTQFLGAVNSSIGAAGAQKTFKTIQSFGVMMGANPEQMKRGTKAIQQMLSKQKLSAEELECRLAA